MWTFQKQRIGRCLSIRKKSSSLTLQPFAKKSKMKQIEFAVSAKYVLFNWNFFNLCNLGNFRFTNHVAYFFGQSCEFVFDWLARNYQGSRWRPARRYWGPNPKIDLILYSKPQLFDFGSYARKSRFCHIWAVEICKRCGQRR